MINAFFGYVVKKQIKSTLKHRYDGCTRPSKNPGFVADNILNRDFRANNPNEKWVTDVTEFKYGTSFDDIKNYILALSMIYATEGRWHVLGDSNNNQLVFDTFDKAIEANPNVHPIFHSNREYQYTSRVFHQRLEDAGIIQSMSRVVHCTDNGPMEVFWGILKREMYYKKEFHSREELVDAILNIWIIA